MTRSLTDARRKLLAAVHASAKKRGLDEDTRRDLQRQATGKESCADMTNAELGRVLDAINGVRRQRAGRGTGAGTPAGGRLPPGRFAAKLRALWISGWHLGVVRDDGDRALDTWVKRTTGIDAVRWVHVSEDAEKAIEGLKAFLARPPERGGGGVDWSAYQVRAPGGSTSVHRPRCRVLEAQWRILYRLGVVKVIEPGALDAYAERVLRIPRRQSVINLEDDQADELIRHFGGRIRAAMDDGDLLGSIDVAKSPAPARQGGTPAPGPGRGEGFRRVDGENLKIEASRPENAP